MANTITNLMPDMLEALDTVSRELTGLIPSVTSDMTFERAAVGQNVRSPVAPAASAGDITPAVTPPDDGDQTIGNQSMEITKARRVPIRWNGEQSRGIDNSGTVSRSRIMQDQFMQAYRTLANEVETDLAGLHVSASRAYGTAGTTPFGTAGDYTDASYVSKILKDNGGPLSGNSLVLGTAAGANLIGKQSRNDMQGNDSMLRQGVLLDHAGFALRESAQIVTNTAGTGADYLINEADGYDVGDTALTLDTGTGTILAGDVITIAGDDNKYVVASALADNVVTIAAPGLRQSAANNAAVTVVSAAARNMAFSRSAIALATRAPALPEEGDSAVDRQIITDPRSGLSFEVAQYMQYRQVQYEVSLAWGVKAVKTEHIALLLG